MVDASRFITVEGIEGVGKTTAVDVIKRYLESQGEHVVLTREPGGTPLAESIRQLILSHHDETLSNTCELMLLFAARAQHVERVIQPALERGHWVICDRFLDATFAYQGGGRELCEDHIQILLDLCLGAFRPGLTLLLDAPLHITMDRLMHRGTARDRIEQESWPFFERVRDRYLLLAKEQPERIRLLDASGDLDTVISQLHQQLATYYQRAA